MIPTLSGRIGRCFLSRGTTGMLKLRDVTVCALSRLGLLRAICAELCPGGATGIGCMIGVNVCIIAAAAPSIDLPMANNNTLNKAASQSTSLYQQCSSLRTRLMRVQDFPPFFSLSVPTDASSSRRSTDPVTQLWDCFALGVPLCFLYNLIPTVQPLVVDCDASSFDPSNEKARKRAIAMFAMGLNSIEGCGTFMVMDLWDRDSTDGFVKVRHLCSWPPFAADILINAGR